MSRICDYCNRESSLTLIIFPCGYSICVNEYKGLADEFNCTFCPSHKIKKQECVNMHKNGPILKEIEYLEEAKSLNDLKDQCDKLNAIKNDLSHYINEHIMNVINKIDLKREELKLQVIKKIDDYSDDLIEFLKKFHIWYEKSLEKHLQYLDTSQLNDIFEFKPEKTEVNVKEKYAFYGNKISNIREKRTAVKKLENQIEEMKKIEFKNNTKEVELNLENTFGTLQLVPYTLSHTFDDLTKLKLEKSINAHSETIWSIEKIGKDELATTSYDMTLKIWNIKYDKLNKVFSKNSGVIFNVKEAENDNLITCSHDCNLKIWNKQSGDCLKTLRNNSQVICIEVFKKKIFSGDTQNQIRVWDLNTGQSNSFQYDHNDHIICLKLLSDKHLLSGSKDTTIKLWDLDSLKCMKTYKSHTHIVTCLERLNDKEFVSGSYDSSIKIWNIEKKSCSMTLNGHRSAVNSFGLIVNGRFLSSSFDKTIILWDSIFGLSLSVFKSDIPITSMRIFDSNKLAIGFDNGKLEIWK